MRRLLTILAAALVLASCQESQGMLYRTLMYGFVQEDGSLLADDGRTYIFSNATSFPDYMAAERVLAMFDVVEAENGSETRFKAMMLQFTLPLYKPVDSCTTDEEIEAFGLNPIDMTACNYSGGCINMENTIYVLEGSEVKHLVSLVHDTSRSSGDTLRLRLCHDAGNDALVSDFDVKRKFVFYSSFPLKDLLPDSGSIVVEIKWSWNDEWNTKYLTLSK